MTSNEYSLEEMIKTFTEHAEIGDRQLQIDIDADHEYTKDQKNHFNISRALLHIVKEIKQLRDKNDN
jgi:hypothetical protein